MEDQEIDENILHQEKEASQKVHGAYRKEEEEWRLKSHNLWLKSGDQNTSFFNKKTQARRQRNIVLKIQIEYGQMLEYFEEIKEVAHEDFKRLYTEDNEQDQDNNAWRMLEHILQKTILEANKTLLQEVTEEEIVQAIWGLEWEKSPGPDGFSIHFFRSFWEVIKSDLKRMINYTLRKKKVGGATNSTFMALIPKKLNPSSFSRLWPISFAILLTKSSPRS
jgi:hypothetical protein